MSYTAKLPCRTVRVTPRLHSFQDETWRVAVEETDVAPALPAIGKAVPPATPPSDEEARAYKTLATALLGPAARQNTREVQVTRVDAGGARLAYLVQSPEPIDWGRTEMAFLRTDFARTEAALPGLDAGDVERWRRVLFSRELRVVAPDGKVIRARHFPPEEDYAAEDVRVLRKADGTGFFLFKPAGDSGPVPFALGQYRLKLTYRRENRDFDPASRILSQAGNRADEVVTIDIPLQTQ
jgi:hypothetical protein